MLTSVAYSHDLKYHISKSTNNSYLPLKDRIELLENGTLQDYIEKCSIYNRTPHFNACIAPYYKNLAKDLKAENILILAEKDLKKLPITDCHFIGHEVGSVNFEKYNYDITKSISDCGQVWLCGGGCSHQVFINIIGNKTEEYIVNLSNEFCTKNSENLPDDFEYLCYHSLGHGLLLISDYNLNNSITYCYNKNKDYNYECLDGIFHQYYFPKLDYNFDTVVQNPEILCPKYFTGLARRTCSERSGKFALTYFGYHDKKTFSKGFELCSKLNFIDKTKCLNGLLVFPENCDKGENYCKLLLYRTKFLNYFIDLFN